MNNLLSFTGFINEKIYGTNNIIVYHRTDDKNALESIVKDGFRVGAAASFTNVGISVSPDLNSLFYQGGNYGKYIIKAKLNHAEDILILNDEIADKFNKGYNLENHLKSKNLNRRDIKAILDSIENNDMGSGQLMKFRDRFQDILHKFSGVAFENMGLFVIIVFNPDVIVPIAYAEINTGGAIWEDDDNEEYEECEECEGVGYIYDEDEDEEFDCNYCDGEGAIEKDDDTNNRTRYPDDINWIKVSKNVVRGNIKKSVKSIFSKSPEDRNIANKVDVYSNHGGFKYNFNLVNKLPLTKKEINLIIKNHGEEKLIELLMKAPAQDVVAALKAEPKVADLIDSEKLNDILSNVSPTDIFGLIKAAPSLASKIDMESLPDNVKKHIERVLKNAENDATRAERKAAWLAKNPDKR